MKKYKQTVAIIGAGASGIASALTIAEKRPDTEIILLEHLDRVCKKINVTGNGKCNLSNTVINAKHYYSNDSKLKEQFILRMPTEKSIDFFNSLGLMLYTDDAGRIYPYCRNASMVTEVLINQLNRYENIKIMLNSTIQAIEKLKSRFKIVVSEAVLYADKVILTTGGKSASKQGSDGSGYQLAKSLGHSVTALQPCLVPLKCQFNGKSSIFKALKGIRVMCNISLYNKNGKNKIAKIAQEYGELQFTDYGISGIPVFQLTCYLNNLNNLKASDYYATVDFFPDLSYSELKTLLNKRLNAKALNGNSVENLLLGLLNKRLQYTLLKCAGVNPDSSEISKVSLDSIANIFKQFKLQITGTLDWEQSQVTLGGVPLSEINSDFSSRIHPNLYLAGEILDITGECGGYNLHWAWCSGQLAGESVSLV